MDVRPGRPDDDTALRALDVATWSHDVSPGPKPTGERQFFGPEEDPADTLVAVVDGEVAGYIKLGQATELDASRHVLMIRGLAVDPGYQRRGVGRALIDAAVEEAAARGVRRLTLRVLAPNVGARTLYESCGFEVEGIQREEFLLDGRYVDDVLMALRVNA
jgi:ribosomal protein S18 acetylase RimI-like enzyme